MDRQNSPAKDSENPQHNEDLQPTRYSFLYFADGDIILSCTKANGSGELFRVHKFMLLHHSSVFEDMFTLKQPPVPDMMDGVPLVNMPDDVEDVESMLHMLYNPMSELPEERMNPNTPVEMMGALKLAHKYQMEHICRRILKHVEHDWSCSLEEWRNHQAHRTNVFNWYNNQPHLEQSGLLLQVSDKFPEPASAIRVAIDYGCPSILPAAFYALAQRQTEYDWDEVKNAPAGSPPRQWLQHESYRFPKLLARWPLLDRTDLRRLRIGETKLRREALRIVGSGCRMLTHFVSICNQPQAAGHSDHHIKCEATSVDNVKGKFAIGPDWVVWQADPLSLLDDMGEGINIGVCRIHRRQMYKWIDSKREEVWKMLPSYFQLD